MNIKLNSRKKIWKIFYTSFYRPFEFYIKLNQTSFNISVQIYNEYFSHKWTCRFIIFHFSKLLFDYRIKFIFPEKKIFFIFIFALLLKENNKNNNKKKNYETLNSNLRNYFWLQDKLNLLFPWTIIRFIIVQVSPQTKNPNLFTIPSFFLCMNK